MADENENIKPEVINITIKAQDGAEVQFRIKKSTKMGKVYEAYAQKKAMDPAHLKLIFEGNRIGRDVTAEAIGLEDADVVDAMLEQVGGCPAPL